MKRQGYFRKRKIRGNQIFNLVFLTLGGRNLNKFYNSEWFVFRFHFIWVCFCFFFSLGQSRQSSHKSTCKSGGVFECSMIIAPKFFIHLALHWCKIFFVSFNRDLGYFRFSCHEVRGLNWSFLHNLAKSGPPS